MASQRGQEEGFFVEEVLHGTGEKVLQLMVTHEQKNWGSLSHFDPMKMLAVEDLLP